MLAIAVENVSWRHTAASPVPKQKTIETPLICRWLWDMYITGGREGMVGEGNLGVPEKLSGCTHCFLHASCRVVSENILAESLDILRWGYIHTK